MQQTSPACRKTIMEYKYEALDAQGNEVKDFINAYDQKSAISAIRNKGLFPTLVRTVGTDSKPCKKKRTSLFGFNRLMTKAEKIMFSIICFLLVIIAGLIKQIIMMG